MMFRKMVGLAFLMAGLAAIASSGCGSRASCIGDAGLQACLMQQRRSQGGTKSEAHGQRKSRPPLQRSIWRRFWTGSKTTSISRVRRTLPRCKQRWSRLGKLTSKRHARTPEVAVQSAFSSLQSRKAAMAKSQTKITELEAAAKQAAEAVEEAKQKAAKLQGEIDKLQKEHDEEAARLVKPSDPVTHLQNTVREAFQAFLEISKCSLSSLSWKQLSQAFAACWRLKRPLQRRPMCATTSTCCRTKRRPSRTRQWPSPGLSSVHWKACPRTSERPRRRILWSTWRKRGTFSHLKRHINTVYCTCSLQAASGKGPSLESLAKILVGEGLPVGESHQKTSWTITTANVITWKSGQLMLDTIPNSDF